MEIRPQVLRDELSKTLVEVNRCLDETKSPSPEVERLLNDYGKLNLITQLLNAKAHCLSALTILQSGSNNRGR
jgi:hypothetical protein